MLLEEDADGRRVLGNPDNADVPSLEQVWRREKDLRAQELGSDRDDPIIVDDAEEEEPASRPPSPARRVERFPLLPINGLEASGNVSDGVLTQKRAGKTASAFTHSRMSE